jgi:hypothetical protein
MTSRDGSKAEASTIWMAPIMRWGWRDKLLKKQLAVAHFNSKIRSDIKVLAG